MKKMDLLLARLEQSEKALAALADDVILAEKLARTPVLHCPPDTPVLEAACLIRQAGGNSIFIMDDGQPVGIWSDRSALQIDPEHSGQKDVPVSQLMNPDVIRVPADASLQELSCLFLETGACQILVMDGQGGILGAVSQSDVALHQGVNHYLRMRTVKSIVQGGLQTVAADTPLGRVIPMVRASRADAVAVSYADGSWGIITAKDILEHVLCGQSGQSGQRVAADIASHPLVTVPLEESALAVRNILAAHRFRHVGVQDENGKLVDILTLGDILGGMEQDYAGVLRYHHEKLNATRLHVRLAQQVIDSALEGVIITDLDSRIIAVNPAFTEITGYGEDEVLGKTPAMFASGRHLPDFYRQMWQKILQTGCWRGEIQNRKKTGEVFLQQLTITALKDEQGTVTSYAATFSDITAQKESEEQIRQLAYYDPLTGLPNRRFIETRLDAEISRAEQEQKLLAVLFIDLDDFKRINDSLGHAIGDLFLKKVAERLQAVMRTNDAVARMGGDEFIALLTDMASPEEAVMVGRRMLASLRQPIRHEEHQLMVSCTIGVSVYPQDGTHADTLISRADTAMYRAKNAGRNGIQMYTDTMSKDSKDQLRLESALYLALKKEEFELYYQPIVNSLSGDFFACEALIRWNRPGLGLVSPAQFLPLAEDLNLMVEITDWVIETGLQQLSKWQQAGFVDLKLSLNMSSKAFFADDFLDKLTVALHRSGANPARVILELTERMLMDDQDMTISRLNAVQSMGVSIALDDFGTGWSSLTHLRSYPLNVLKIDREFVLDVNNVESRDASIIEAIARLARNLKLNVVAEGVESRAQIETLNKLGCRLIQGYYYSPPVPAESMTKLLTAGKYSKIRQSFTSS